MADETVTHQPAKLSVRTKTALWLLIAPTALWVVIIIMYAITNFVFGRVDGTMTLREGGIIQTIINVLLFLSGIVAFISWLPGLIVGIVLLATKPQPAIPPKA